MAKLALTVFLVALFQVITVHAVYTEDKCIKGKWHKASPSPETKEFKTCHAFKESSCCTAEFTAELMANETRNLYNHSWHRCGQLSQKCQQFWVTQECFYQCSPKVYKWVHPTFKEALKGVPVCSNICDQWFDACKTDQICVENVLEDYNFTIHGENLCPANKSCVTYQAMYGNGKNLCEKMWGGSYIYTTPNADYSNCLMMDGSKPTVGSHGVINTACVTFLVILFSVALML
ncbi:hypothetical protein ACROYT_G024400 [Oculina patagonica]